MKQNLRRILPHDSEKQSQQAQAFQETGKPSEAQYARNIRKEKLPGKLYKERGYRYRRSNPDIQQPTGKIQAARKSALGSVGPKLVEKLVDLCMRLASIIDKAYPISIKVR